MTADIEQLVRNRVASFGTRCQLLPCDPEYADTAAFCEHYGYALDESANTIVVASRAEPAQFAAAIVLADSKLDVNKTLRKLMGVRRLSFASAEQTMELTGMMLGGVTPFGLPDDLDLYIDSRVMEGPAVILGGGSRSLKVRAEPEVLLELGAVVVEGLGIRLQGGG